MVIHHVFRHTWLSEIGMVLEGGFFKQPESPISIRLEPFIAIITTADGSYQTQTQHTANLSSHVLVDDDTYV